MFRRRLLAIPAGLTLVASVIAASAQTATADSPYPGKGQQATVATGPQVPSSKMPDLSPMAGLTGYRVASSAALTDPANSQSYGSVSCAKGMKAVGGGAVISGTQITENINSSYPTGGGTGWQVYVNNASSTDGTFTAYAVCVKKVAKYSVVGGAGVDNPAGSQTRASATCPAKTVPLGGGGIGSSGSTLVNLNSSYPVSNGWVTDVNNGSTGTDTAYAYVVCGKKPKGYALVAGTAVTVSPNSQDNATVSCASGTVPLSGGSLSSSLMTTVNINSEVPTNDGWRAYQDNADTAASNLAAYAVCAQAAS